MFLALDHQFMARALRLADRGKYWARPNPHVACVLVRDSAIVGEGFTQPAGGDHAEVMALKSAGDAARGSTAYVTLEPCAHHGRTPPCSQALIKAGVARVVVGIRDPNPKVDGGGLKDLIAAGIDVTEGLMADQVELQLAGFLLRQRRGRPRLRIKLAMSLDGRTAMESGESQWITGADARRDVQRLRAESCAILTGIGTVLSDDCALTVRDTFFADELLPPPERRALRVVADTHLRTPSDAAVLQGAQPSLLLHAKDAACSDSLAAVDRLALPVHGGSLVPAEVLTALAARECNEILLESGPTLAGAMLQSGLVDQLIIYMAPVLLGSRARPLLELPFDRMAEALRLRLVDRRQIGADQRFVFEPQMAG
ncbi:bifunctional diaminohydroxyphosphoribosylaminopyrimidine deaminase/5-amino-6-(5-phosphoribosylamino)uracil reductase RibD [Congregibacter sp.]|nr:bifunctional diaminohydroxyphosphoribosylaminopyrimidine deaminase/5-amino-6-(5-phosphoribosylamino)uracil reductase RibD [Congregibacter sp.]MDA8961984.1 bifunctional diaminohydroxyphosphoribosylaminopyrimidine deaminase/5-amino-6-(5-phosphoribosylamino)uracil reductase RibD [Congregibacter sp.]